MGDINFISGIVKILETPKQKIIQNNFGMTMFRAQFPQVRKSGIVHLTIWSNLDRDIPTYYKINDYMLIEGYLSIRNKENQQMDFTVQLPKKIEITASKIYPYLFNYDRSRIPSSNF